MCPLEIMYWRGIPPWPERKYGLSWTSDGCGWYCILFYSTRNGSSTSLLYSLLVALELTSADAIHACDRVPFTEGNCAGLADIYDTSLTASTTTAVTTLPNHAIDRYNSTLAYVLALVLIYIFPTLIFRCITERAAPCNVRNRTLRSNMTCDWHIPLYHARREAWPCNPQWNEVLQVWCR